MDDSGDRTTGEQVTAVVNRTLAAGMAAVAALAVIALLKGEAVATAVVAAVGTIVAALIGLARAYVRRSDR